ncbi:uncharacterized protein LOC134282379 [Saccostrea cucullata]|uniref:uncharacterized protein LOC134282379 n=1 Tax=Saccostrea cuccullata TaxID=36930 RepID=UPI002ED6BE64
MKKLKKKTPSLPEERPIGGLEQDLKGALNSPEKSTITGKVVMVSPLRYRQEGTLAVRSLILKDQKTTAKVCLFANNAELHFNHGDVVKVSAVYKKQYNQRTQLTSSPGTVCEMVGDSLQVEITEEDKQKGIEDPDFSDVLPEEMQTKDIILTDFTDCDVYQCCDMPPCRRKKISGNKCPLCGKESNKSAKSYKVQFLYEVDGKKDNIVTLFQNTIEKIIKESADFDTKEDIISTIIEKLPIRFKAAISNNSFVNVSH